MKRAKFLIALLVAMPLWAADYAPLGDSVSGAFFRDWYHNSDLVYYLEALNDHTILETNIQGQWWLPERLSIAIEGLPGVYNRWYIDGFRADDRFQPGSTQFVPAMETHNMRLSTRTAQLYFTHDTTVSNRVYLSGNVGGITNGEPMAGTAAIINIMHRTPMQSADCWQHVTARRHMKGTGTADAIFTLHDKAGNPYRQHVYAHYGQRMLTRENERGLITQDPYYGAYYYKVQADGYLPMRPNRHFEQIGYRLNFAGRNDAGSEYFYNYDEVYDLKNYTASLYAKRKGLTTGLTFATNTVSHSNPSFSRNVIDQDGESFAPWIADGNTHELSWGLTYKQPLSYGLQLHIDAYNSVLFFRPETTQWSNMLYLQAPLTPTESAARRDMYRYDWSAKPFTGGLLENSITLQGEWGLCRVLDLKAFVGLSVDGILLSGKSIVTPNALAGVELYLHPCSWFDIRLALENQRLPYTVDYIRYLSNDYMNASVYAEEMLVSTTGGYYHHYTKGLWQPSYLELDIPIRFHWGRHEIVLQQSYKKFYHTWTTRYQNGVEAALYSRDIDGTTVYFEYAGEKQYEIGYADGFGKGFCMSSPYYFSQLTRYTYAGRKVLFTLSWQSMQAAGECGLGNGALMNNVGTLSETTANPNTHNVLENPKGKYKGVGRYNLDKGYVARMYIAYNICQYVQAGLAIKWTDGKPFTPYHYYEDAGQVAILPISSRGTNPTDGNFGKRLTGVFNLDLHIQGRWQVRDVGMRLRVECYNIWDFCIDEAELAFTQDIPQAKRASFIMNVPTGLLFTYGIDL